MTKYDVDINKNIRHTKNEKQTNENAYIFLNDDLIPVPKLSLTQASIVVTCFALICFWHTQHATFTFDDNSAILSNKDIQTETPLWSIFYNDFWGTNIRSKTSHKSYRPLTVLTYRLNYFLSGGYHPCGFHLGNIILHAVNSVLLLRIVSKIFSYEANTFGAPKASLLCAVLFAVHPIHTESVASTVGRADLLSTMFFMFSFQCFVNCCKEGWSEINYSINWKQLFRCLFTAFLSMFCKEQGITVLGVCIAYDIIMVYRFNVGKFQKMYYNGMLSKDAIQVLKRVTVLSLAAAFFITIRIQIMGSRPPQFQYLDNPASFQESWTLRVVNYIYIYSMNMWLLLDPWWLCFDWAMGCIPVISSFGDNRIIFPVLLVTIFIALVVKIFVNLEKYLARLLAMSLVFLVVPFLPAMNIFFRVGFVIAERNLYISSIGFVLLMVNCFILLQTKETCRKVVNVCMVLLIPLFIARSIHRSKDWMNEEVLFNSGVHVCPLNAKVHYNIGKISQDKGDIDAAIKSYLEAIRLHPGYDQPMNNIGNVYKEKQMLKEAEYYLERAVQVSPKFATAWMNLGSVKADLSKKEESIECYSEAVRIRKHYPDAYFNWGNLYLQYKEYDEALVKFKMAIHQKAEHYQAWLNTIMMLGEIGRGDELKPIAAAAVKQFPTDDHMYYSIGNSFGKADELKEAEKYAKKSIELNPNLSNSYGNLGVIYHRLKKYDDAAIYYKKCLELDPQNTFMRENYNKLLNVLKAKP